MRLQTLTAAAIDHPVNNVPQSRNHFSSGPLIKPISHHHEINDTEKLTEIETPVEQVEKQTQEPVNKHLEMPTEKLTKKIENSDGKEIDYDKLTSTIKASGLNSFLKVIIFFFISN